MKANLSGTLIVDGQEPIHIPPQEITVRRSDEKNSDPVAMDSLSGAQRSVVRLLARGMTVEGIASKLDRSPHTVRNHLKASMRHFKVHTQIQLLKAAGYVLDTSHNE